MSRLAQEDGVRASGNHVRYLSLFGFLMHLGDLASLAELAQLQARLDLLVFGGVIVDLATFLAGQLDKVILGHNDNLKLKLKTLMSKMLVAYRSWSSGSWLTRPGNWPTRRLTKVVEPERGVEPPTFALQKHCSAIELLRRQERDGANVTKTNPGSLSKSDC